VSGAEQKITPAETSKVLVLCIVTLCGNIHLSTPLDHKIIWPGSSLNGSAHRQGKTN